MPPKKKTVNLDDHGTEILRFFAKPERCIVSIRSTGELYTKRTSHDWMLAKRFKRQKDWTDEQYQALLVESADRIKSKLEPWQINANLPPLSKIKKWVVGEDNCVTPTGHVVEPDGVGPDGVPSWLILLGMI